VGLNCWACVYAVIGETAGQKLQYATFGDPGSYRAGSRAALVGMVVSPSSNHSDGDAPPRNFQGFNDYPMGTAPLGAHFRFTPEGKP